MALQKPMPGHAPSRNSRSHGIFAGRIVSYAITGAMAASLGRGLQPHPLGAKILLLGASLLLLFASIQWLKDARVWPRSLGQSIVARPFQPFAKTVTQALGSLHLRLVKFGRWQPWVIGLAYPLMPCGQLWAVMGVSALSAHPLHGMFIAGGFALLTTPTLWGATWIQMKLRTWLSASNAIGVSAGLPARPTSRLTRIGQSLGPQILRAGLVALMLSLSLWSGWRFFDLSRHPMATMQPEEVGSNQGSSHSAHSSAEKDSPGLALDAHAPASANAPRCH